MCFKGLGFGERERDLVAQCFRERKKIFFKIKILCMRERVTLWVEETILWEKMWTTERERERRIFKPNFGICHLMLVSKVFEYHFWNDTISEFESQSSKKKKNFLSVIYFSLLSFGWFRETSKTLAPAFLAKSEILFPNDMWWPVL